VKDKENSYFDKMRAGGEIPRRQQIVTLNIMRKNENIYPPFYFIF